MWWGKTRSPPFQGGGRGGCRSLGVGGECIVYTSATPPVLPLEVKFEHLGNPTCPPLGKGRDEVPPATHNSRSFIQLYLWPKSIITINQNP